MERDRRNNSGKPFDLGERLFQFARRILDVCAKIPEGPESTNLRQQLSSAGTSAGANYEEGCEALSTEDKVKCFKTSRKETRETRYWLRLLAGKYLPESEVAPDVGEATEIIKIFTAIIEKIESSAEAAARVERRA
ncbi:MAG: four helix bundle protein [Planctomycetes bacterium]|nr:four helix bundle protein [Planctomycetota bacterium]